MWMQLILEFNFSQLILQRQPVMSKRTLMLC